MGLTAEGFFVTANNELHASAKEWTKHTAEGCSVVVTLIATIAFSAAYSVPGGSNESTGSPVLINEPVFIAFTMADVLFVTSSLGAVVIFLSILASPFRLTDFRRTLPRKMMLGFIFLFCSVCIMMKAFTATVMMILRTQESWAKIVLYASVGIFMLSFFPYLYNIPREWNYLYNKTRQLIPQSFVTLVKNIFCFSPCTKVQAANSSIP